LINISPIYILKIVMCRLQPGWPSLEAIQLSQHFDPMAIIK